MNPLKFPELMGKSPKKVKASVLINREMYSSGVTALEYLIARANSMTPEELEAATRCPNEDQAKASLIVDEARLRCVQIMLEHYSPEELARDIVGRTFREFNQHIAEGLASVGHAKVLERCRDMADDLEAMAKEYDI